jgi:hypothetical protein
VDIGAGGCFKKFVFQVLFIQGILKGGASLWILTSCLTGFESAV